jgi:hypothetical protein
MLLEHIPEMQYYRLHLLDLHDTAWLTDYLELTFTASVDPSSPPSKALEV